MLDICQRFTDMAEAYTEQGQQERADDIIDCLHDCCTACVFGNEDCFANRPKRMAEGQFSVMVATQPANRHINGRINAQAAVTLAMNVAHDIGCRVVLRDQNETTVIHTGIEHDDTVLFT